MFQLYFTVHYYLESDLSHINSVDTYYSAVLLDENLVKLSAAPPTECLIKYCSIYMYINCCQLASLLLKHSALITLILLPYDSGRQEIINLIEYSFKQQNTSPIC